LDRWPGASRNTTQRFIKHHAATVRQPRRHREAAPLAFARNKAAGQSHRRALLPVDPRYWIAVAKRRRPSGQPNGRALVPLRKSCGGRGARLKLLR
jgi:hypothetical protein